MERVVEWEALLGLRCGGRKVQKTSRDSEETSLDHKRFSIDAVSSRKSSGTTKSKKQPISESLMELPRPVGDGGRGQMGKQTES